MRSSSSTRETTCTITPGRLFFIVMGRKATSSAPAPISRSRR